MSPVSSFSWRCIAFFAYLRRLVRLFDLLVLLHVCVVFASRLFNMLGLAWVILENWPWVELAKFGQLGGLARALTHG